MRILILVLTCGLVLSVFSACSSGDTGATKDAGAGAGLKIAYVNGDTILHKYEEFRKLAEEMDAKQRKAEEELKSRGADLEKEILAYQKKAQSGTMTGKEMEAREKYLASRQEGLMMERDKMAQAIMEETSAINKQLQTILDEKLEEIKKKEGYSIIFNHVEGGAILAIDSQYDITAQVLRMLNDNAPPGGINADTTKK